MSNLKSMMSALWRSGYDRRLVGPSLAAQLGAEFYLRGWTGKHYAASNEHWITIGGKGGSKGTHIRIDGSGRIMAGPDGLLGQKLSDLPDRESPKPKPKAAAPGKFDRESAIDSINRTYEAKYGDTRASVRPRGDGIGYEAVIGTNGDSRALPGKQGTTWRDARDKAVEYLENLDASEGPEPEKKSPDIAEKHNDWPSASTLEGGHKVGAAFMSIDQLSVDPDRFQYKIEGIDPAKGVTDEFADVGKFEPEFAGTLLVWFDPSDNKTYVINGHHRAEIAKRTGYKGPISVFYTPAETAAGAKARGALANVAGGKGTAVDAANFMRHAKVSSDELAAKGVSLKGDVAAEGMILAKLPDEIFARVEQGLMTKSRGLAIGKHLDRSQADELWKVIKKREAKKGGRKREAKKGGRAITNGQIEEMAREMSETPKVTTEGKDLFGSWKEEKSVFVERGILKDHIAKLLADDKNAFRSVANEERAKRIGNVGGNVVDIEANKQRKQSAEVQAWTFRQQANLRGELSDAINRGAERLGENPRDHKRIKRETYEEAVRILRGPDESGLPGSSGGGGEPAKYRRCRETGRLTDLLEREFYRREYGHRCTLADMLDREFYARGYRPGKGQRSFDWKEGEHPRDDDGKFTSGGDRSGASGPDKTSESVRNETRHQPEGEVRSGSPPKHDPVSVRDSYRKREGFYNEGAEKLVEDAISKLPESVRSWMSVAKPKIEYWSKGMRDSMSLLLDSPEILNAAAICITKSDGEKYVVVIEGNRIDPEILQHEFVHYAWKYVPAELKSEARYRLINNGKEIADTFLDWEKHHEKVESKFYSPSKYETTKKAIEFGRKHGVPDSLFMKAIGEPYGIVDEISKYLELTPINPQYSNMAMFYYLANEAHAVHRLPLAYRSEEPVAWLSGLDEDFAKRIFEGITKRDNHPTEPYTMAAAMAREFYGHGWEESKHPRGKPENAGQFSESPSGSATAVAEPPEPAQQAQPAQQVDQAQEVDQAQDWKQNGTRSQAFKQWFGDWESGEGASKVVNQAGDPQETYPIKVYHGTDQTFGAFDIDSAQQMVLGRGFYFTEDEAEAASYGKNAVAAYLNIRNPWGSRIVLSSQGRESIKNAYSKVMQKSIDEPAPLPPEADEWETTDWNRSESKRQQAAAILGNPNATGGEIQFHLEGMHGDYVWQQVLQQSGFDGQAIENQSKDGKATRWWIAFEPSQIKSAANRGTFDPNDDRMEYGAGWDESDHTRDSNGKFGQTASAVRPPSKLEQARREAPTTREVKASKPGPAAAPHRRRTAKGGTWTNQGSKWVSASGDREEQYRQDRDQLVEMFAKAFDESEHPRDSGGLFTSGSGGTATAERPETSDWTKLITRRSLKGIHSPLKKQIAKALGRDLEDKLTKTETREMAQAAGANEETIDWVTANVSLKGFLGELLSWMRKEYRGDAYDAAKTEIGDSTTALLEVSEDIDTGHDSLRLMLHRSVRTDKGNWQLTVVGKGRDGSAMPLSHQTYDTKDDAIRSATGNAENYLDNEGSDRYEVTWTNQSGKPAPFARENWQDVERYKLISWGPTAAVKDQADMATRSGLRSPMAPEQHEPKPYGAGFDESKHDRDDDGKFSSSGTGTATRSEPWPTNKIWVTPDGDHMGVGEYHEVTMSQWTKSGEVNLGDKEAGESPMDAALRTGWIRMWKHGQERIEIEATKWDSSTKRRIEDALGDTEWKLCQIEIRTGHNGEWSSLEIDRKQFVEDDFRIESTPKYRQRMTFYSKAFDESDHKRDGDGKFAAMASASKTNEGQLDLAGWRDMDEHHASISGQKSLFDDVDVHRKTDAQKLAMLPDKQARKAKLFKNRAEREGRKIEWFVDESDATGNTYLMVKSHRESADNLDAYDTLTIITPSGKENYYGIWPEEGGKRRFKRKLIPLAEWKPAEDTKETAMRSVAQKSLFSRRQGNLVEMFAREFDSRALGPERYAAFEGAPITVAVEELGEKASTAQANYRAAIGPIRCENCGHYRSKACGIVKGEIRAEDACDLWKPESGEDRTAALTEQYAAQAGVARPQSTGAARWEETKHPRAADGKFGHGGGSAAPLAPTGPKQPPQSKPPQQAKQEPPSRPGAAQGTAEWPGPPDRREGPSNVMTDGLKRELSEIQRSYPPANPDGTDTESMYRTPDGQWTPERQRLHETIISKFFAGKQPSANPTFTLMGGGTAAGKSTILKSGSVTIDGDPVAVDSDEIKGQLPEYNAMAKDGYGPAALLSHEESSYLAKEVMNRSLAGSYDTLLDGTGDSNLEKLSEKVQQARQAGQRVVAHYVTIDTDTAVARSMERGNHGDKQGRHRWVPEDLVRHIHKDVSGIFPHAVSAGLFDEVSLWRSGNPPVSIGSGVGSNFTVHDQGLYEEFLAKSTEGGDAHG